MQTLNTQPLLQCAGMNLDINDFQKHSVQTLAITDKNIAALAHRTLGISGEAGILSNTIKRIIRDKQGQTDEEDLEVIKERLGDVLYYVATLADYYDLKLSDVAEQNMEQSSAFQQSHEATN